MERFESPLVLYVNGRLDLVETCAIIKEWAADQPDSELGDAADYLDSLYAKHQIGEHVQKKLLQSLYYHRQHPREFAEDEETVFRTPVDVSDEETVFTPPEAPADDDATMLAADLEDDEATVLAGNDAETVVASMDDVDTAFFDAGSPADELGPGSILKGRFNLVSVLGEGGMGRVYKAIDMLKVEAKDSNPYVAIKLLTGDFKEHPDAFIALQRETSKAQKLAHPNISTVYDFDRHNETVYMTMELLEGAPLDEYIKSMPEGGLEIDQALAIVEELAAGLGYAHQQGLVHSDFKPGNAFILDDGNVKVIDFGIARAAATGLESDAPKGPTSAATPAYETTGEATDSSSTGGTVDVFDAGTLGALTPSYATIEMFEGEAPHPSDDIYALACVAVLLLTGKHPYNKKPAPKARDAGMKPPVVPGLTSRQQRALDKALEFTRDKRTQNMDEFLDGIRKRKSYVKQIVFGSLAVIALVSAIGYAPMMNYYEQKELDELIVNTNNGTDADVRATLAALPAYDAAKQFSIRTGIRDRALNIFTREMKAAVDFDKGLYDFDRADAIAEEALSYYPDSAAIKELRTGNEARRLEEVAQLEQDFYVLLVDNAFYPEPDVQDMADVLRLFSLLDADNTIITDPRLEYGYYAAAAENRKLGDDDRADTYIDIGHRYIPHSELFADLNDGVVLRKLELEAAARIDALALPADAESLADYRPYVDDLAVAAFPGAGEPTGYAAFLDSYRDARTGDRAGSLDPAVFVPALPFQLAADLADSAAPADIAANSLASLHVIEDDSTLESVLAGIGRIKRDLARHGNAALAQYSLDYPRLVKHLSEQKRHTLIAFYNRVFGGMFLDEILAATDTIQEQTSARYAEYLAAVKLRADVENDKRIFRNIADQNRLNDSIQVYNKIAKHSSDEEFMDYARSEISRMYLTLAESIATESQFESALAYAQSAQKYVADERTQKLVDEYRKEITLEQLPPLIVAGTEELKQQAIQKLRYLRKTFPDDYPFFINRIAATINEDIIIRASENLLDAHRLKDHALSIVNSRIIRNVAIKALPEPSKLALQGKIEVSQHKLSAAKATYAKALAETPDHYQVKELDELLEAELVIARNHFKAYDRHYSDEQYAKADEALRLAQEAWVDNVDYQQEREFYDRILRQVATDALLCRTDIQGLGRQSRGVCRDKLLVSKLDAPTMVVIPAATTRDEPYAISKYEISIRELNEFCDATGACARNDDEDPDLPAKSVPLTLIEKYVDWLTAESGFVYSLATRPQWLNAASAGGREGNTNYNCRLRLGTKMIKGQNIVPVTSGTANNWGLVNYVGNVDELVSTEQGYELVGGNFSDSISDCKVTLRKEVRDNYELAGFRLVRALN